MEEYIDHDGVEIFSHKKKRRDSKLSFGPIPGVLPFDGMHNPSGMSTISQKFHLPYRTESDGFQIRHGMCESSAEYAVALEALISGNLLDLKFQPATVRYQDESGKMVRYTHDLLLHFKCGHRRLAFVRNGKSLAKETTLRAIHAIVAATPKSLADDMIIVNADTYTKQRKDNLRRIYTQQGLRTPDAVDTVLLTALKLSSLYNIQQLIAECDLPGRVAFPAIYYLIATGRLQINMDHVITIHSRIWLPSGQDSCGGDHQ